MFWIFNPGSYSPYTFQQFTIETPKNVHACFKMVHAFFSSSFMFSFRFPYSCPSFSAGYSPWRVSVGITSEASCLTTSFSHFGAGGTAAMQLREPDVKANRPRQLEGHSSPPQKGLVGWDFQVVGVFSLNHCIELGMTKSLESSCQCPIAEWWPLQSLHSVMFTNPPSW